MTQEPTLAEKVQADLDALTSVTDTLETDTQALIQENTDLSSQVAALQDWKDAVLIAVGCPPPTP